MNRADLALAIAESRRQLAIWEVELAQMDDPALIPAVDPWSAV